MPLAASLVSAAVAIGAIAGTAMTTQNWSQQRSKALYAEIDATVTPTIGDRAQAKVAEKKETQKKAQRRKQTTEKSGAAPDATTGVGTREPNEPEDAEPPGRMPERPYGIMDLLFGN